MNPNEIKEAFPLTWKGIENHVMKTCNYPRFVWYLHEDNIFRLRHYFDSVRIDIQIKIDYVKPSYTAIPKYTYWITGDGHVTPSSISYSTRQEAEQAAIERAFGIREAQLKGDNQK